MGNRNYVKTIVSKEEKYKDIRKITRKIKRKKYKLKMNNAQ